jgi:hypothetical protein
MLRRQAVEKAAAFDERYAPPGDERLFAEIRRLAALIQRKADAGDWEAAHRAWSVAADRANQWKARVAAVEAQVERAKAARRAQYQRTGTEANRRRAAKAARKYVAQAKRVVKDRQRKGLPPWPPAAVVAYLRRTTTSPPSVTTLYRYLKPLGLK